MSRLIWNRRLLLVLVSVCPLLALVPRSVRAARPYDVLAVYARGDGEEDASMKVSDGMMLPDGGEGWKLKTIRVHFRREGLGATTPAIYRNFAVGIKDGNAAHDVWKSIQAEEIDPSADLDMVSWSDQVGDGRRVAALGLEIQGKFSREFLCSQELLYRHEHGTLRRPPGAKGETDKSGGSRATTDAAVFSEKAELRHQYALTTKGGVEILYSFCKDQADIVNWKEAAKIPAFSMGETDPDKLKEEHKARLFEMLSKDGALSKFNVSYDPKVLLGSSAGLPTNVFVSDSMKITILRTGGLFGLTEEAGDGTHPLSRLIDQRSVVAITAASKDGVCASMQERPFVYKVKQGDKDPKTLNLKFNDACKASLAVAFKEFLGTNVTLSISYQFPDDKKTEVVLHQAVFDVENLGLITTFPVVSEVYTAASKPSLDDIESTSSIPISYALPLSGGSATTLAVTFPWKISYNTRNAPRVAEIISFFPHLSVIGSDSSGSGQLKLALGVGVSLAQFLSVSWAATVSQDQSPRHYLLFGVSAPYIAKLFASPGK